MKNLTEKEIEEFIKKNKNEFNVYRPSKNHDKRFLALLMIKLRRAFINITPYLIGTAIAVVLIWLFTIAIWKWLDLPTLWDLYIDFLKK